MRLVTQTEFGKLMGVNRSTVHRWLQSGIIERASGTRKLDLDECRVRVERYQQTGSIQKQSPKTAAGAIARTEQLASGAGGGSFELTDEEREILARREVNKAREIQAKADQAEMNARARRGELLEMEEVQEALQRVAAEARVAFEGLGSALAGEDRDLRARIDEAVTERLQQLCVRLVDMEPDELMEAA